MINSSYFQSNPPVQAAIEFPNGPRDLLSDGRQNLTVILLALMMFLVPALGVPGKELLQDTLKSMLVSFFALAAAFSFFWAQREQKSTMHFHGLLCFPLGLMAYALGSMAWSHAYLGGVEAIRWFVLSLILFLGMNTLTLARVTQLAWGIHLGAVVASLWTALQFWVDFSFFAQFAAPASTFVNRNFFAEFLVCTLPTSVFLMSRVRSKTAVFLLAPTLGFNVVALMMTGARAALMGLLLLLLLIPVIVGLYRKQWGAAGWRAVHGVALIALLIATVGGLGSVNSSNARLVAEYGQGDAIDRAFRRTLSVAQAEEYASGSFSVRTRMWKETGRMIRANPVIGVGAGAWEVQTPLYQAPGSQLETEFYAHNEILQLLAEYGLVGWLSLVGLLSYLLWAAYRTWSNQTHEGQAEAPLRALSLASLLMLLLVSNAGFPWRLATTGALFALNLSILAASDVRLGAGRNFMWRVLPWRARYRNGALGATALCLALTLYIAQQAAACEARLARAYELAQTITRSGRSDDQRWDQAKAEILRLMRESIAINSHYRKITPLVADELASWGDWANAAWIWESVLLSRPHVVVIAANISRAYLQTRDYQKSLVFFDRAAKLQPTAPAVRAMHALLLIQSWQYPQAEQVVRGLLHDKAVDDSVISLTYLLGSATRDWTLTIQALKLRIQQGPIDVADDWLNLGNVYSKAEVSNEAEALASYRAALSAVPSYRQDGVWAKIPPIYRAKLQSGGQP